MNDNTDESPLRIVDVDIAWLFLVDLKDWLSHVPKAGMAVYQSPIAEGMILYHSPHEGLSALNEVLVKTDAIKPELESQLQADLDVIDAEYRESQRFTRLKLKGFTLVLPTLGKQRVRVNVSLHRSGIGVITMILSLKDAKFTPSELIRLQLLPKANTLMTFLLPFELIQEYSRLNQDVASALKEQSTGKEDFSLDASLNEVVWYYWSSIVNAIWKIGSEDKLLKSLRYEVFTAYPVIFLQKTLPEYESPKALLTQHPRQIFGILTQVMRQPLSTIRVDVAEKMFQEDLSERRDISLFIALESTLLINSMASWRVLESIAQEKETSIEYESRYDLWTLITVIELLQVQRQLLWLYDYLLASGPGESLSPRQLAQEKEEITRGLDEFYNIKVAAQREACMEIEYGKRVFRIDDLFTTVTGKLDLLAEAANTLHTLRMEAFGLVLTVLLSIIPLVFAFPEVVIILGNVLMLAAYLLSGVVWKRRRAQS